MKALTKEHLIKAIDANFKADAIILQNNGVLKRIWEQFGDE